MLKMKRRLLDVFLRYPQVSCSGRCWGNQIESPWLRVMAQFRCILIKRQLPRWTWFTTQKGLIQQSITSRGTFKPKRHLSVRSSQAVIPHIKLWNWWWPLAAVLFETFTSFKALRETCMFVCIYLSVKYKVPVSIYGDFLHHSNQKHHWTHYNKLSGKQC